MVVQWYFATLLLFPLARRSNYRHGGRLEVARLDWAGRQKDYLSSHRILYSAEVFRWTETQEPYHLRRQHEGEGSLVKAKIFNSKVNTGMKCNGNSIVNNYSRSARWNNRFIKNAPKIWKTKLK